MKLLRSSIYLLGGMTALAAADVRAQVSGILPTAQDEPTRQGTRGANFLHLPIGARANAMGGAVASSVVGPTAWFWNAAGAVTSEGFSIAAGRHQLYGNLDIPQSYAAVSMPILGGVAGISFNTLSSGQMERTTEANPFGQRLGGADFAWNSTAAGLGYARRLTDRLSAGGVVKYVSEGISDASTSWIAFDLGTQFNTGIYGLSLGGAIQNVGGSARATGAGIRTQINTADQSVFVNATDVALATSQVELPLEFRFSIGVDVLGSAESLLSQAPGTHRLYAEVNANDAVDIAPQLGIGAEYSFRNIVFARAGKHFYNDDRTRGMDGGGTYGLSGGFGLRFPLLGRVARFDYSYTNMADLQNVQAFSIEVGR